MINLYYLVMVYTSHKHLVIAMVQTAVHWHGIFGESQSLNEGTVSAIRIIQVHFCGKGDTYIAVNHLFVFDYLYTGWWFGTWLLFSMIYGMSSFPLTNIFKRG